MVSPTTVMDASQSAVESGLGDRGRKLQRSGLARSIGAVACSGCVAACSGVQSALDPGGPHAQAIADLFWLLTGIGVATLVPITALLVLIVRRLSPDRINPLALDDARERRANRVVGICVAATVV